MGEQADRGYVYAAVGHAYVTLARRSARALRLVEPLATIDLFTDKVIDDPVFERVHLLDHISRRPKIEALQRSRFARTVYLDADTLAIAPISELFDLLGHFDIALAAEAKRADSRNLRQDDAMPVPHAFAPLNSGVIALRRSDRTTDFLLRWHQRVHDGTQKYDQMALREMLYRSDLRLYVLPGEYNAMWLGPYLSQGPSYCAPRLLHSPHLHESAVSDPSQPLDLSEILSPKDCAQLQKRLKRDPSVVGYQSVHFSIVDRPRKRPQPRWVKSLRAYLRGPI
jgi:hypothetical protein